MNGRANELAADDRSAMNDVFNSYGYSAMLKAAIKGSLEKWLEN